MNSYLGFSCGVTLLVHALGGLSVRYYQQRYPTEVVVLVLIHAAHEEQRERLLAALLPEVPDDR